MTRDIAEFYFSCAPRGTFYSSPTLTEFQMNITVILDSEQ